MKPSCGSKHWTLCEMVQCFLLHVRQFYKMCLLGRAISSALFSSSVLVTLLYLSWHELHNILPVDCHPVALPSREFMHLWQMMPCTYLLYPILLLPKRDCDSKSHVLSLMSPPSISFIFYPCQCQCHCKSSQVFAISHSFFTHSVVQLLDYERKGVFGICTGAPLSCSFNFNTHFSVVL